MPDILQIEIIKSDEMLYLEIKYFNFLAIFANKSIPML